MEQLIKKVILAPGLINRKGDEGIGRIYARDELSVSDGIPSLV